VTSINIVYKKYHPKYRNTKSLNLDIPDNPAGLAAFAIALYIFILITGIIVSHINYQYKKYHINYYADNEEI
jgi:hypothetical protein